MNDFPQELTKTHIKLQSYYVGTHLYDFDMAAMWNVNIFTVIFEIDIYIGISSATFVPFKVFRQLLKLLFL